MKILHIITGLGRGGAETLLYQFCIHDKEYEHIVISLSGTQDYSLKLRRLNISVHSLNFSNSKISIKGLYKLYKLIRQIKPDIIQTWMIHADMVGGIVGRLAGIKNIFWGVHHSNLTGRKSKNTTRLIIKVNSILSYFIPKKIIYCANSSKKIQESIGFKKSIGVVISNGYNTNIFKNNDTFRKSFRNEHNISDDTFIIGHVGRYSPLKDQTTLIEAFHILEQKGYKFKLVLVGTNLDRNNIDLVSFLNKKELSDKVLLLGRRDDIPKIMNGIDLFVLSSITEAFPNVLNEAMACGTPCVSTNVGDSSLIIDSTGWVTQKKNQKVLANSITEAYEEKKLKNTLWLKRKLACRDRIVKNFSLEEMIKRYKDIWRENS